MGQEGRPPPSIPDPAPANQALEAAQANGTAIDITNFHAGSQSADCADYAGAYTASVMNLGGGPLAIVDDPAKAHESAVVVTGDDESCILISDNIPSHDFNDDSAGFRDPVNEVGRSFNIPRNPEFADSPTFIGQQAYNGVMLNGIPIDLLGAGCYRPDADDIYKNVEFDTVGGGCNADEEYFLLNVFHPNNHDHYLVDLHNGHPQVFGDYHYHGNPAANLNDALFDNDNGGENGSPVIGFASDGFPIFGSYFKDENGEIRKAASGYTLKAGTRDETAPANLAVPNPGGAHDGMYNSDYEFTDAGDLDECNGMTVNGQYGYYITDDYPFVMKCMMGVPDLSFDK